MAPVPVLSNSWKATMKRASGAHNTDSNARNSWNEMSLQLLVCMSWKRGDKKDKLLNTWNTLEGSQDQIILKQLNLITNTLWVMTCDAAPKSVTTWMLLVGKKGKTQCSKKRQRDDLWLKIKWEVSTQSEGRAEVAQPLYYYCPGEFLILTEPVFINVKSVLLASQLCQSC